jgi:hypothetical protein
MMRRAFESARALRWLLAGYAAFVAFIVAVSIGGIDALDLFRDPSELSPVFSSDPWKSSFTVFAVCLWMSAAVVFMFAGAVLRGWGEAGDRSWFFLAGGAVFLVLGLDDGLAIHEQYTPHVVGHHGREGQELFDALLVVGWAVRFRRPLLSSNLLVFGLAVAGIGGGAVIDKRDLVGVDFRADGLIEETMEFCGLATLVVWAAGEAWRALVPARLREYGTSRRVHAPPPARDAAELDVADPLQ